MALRVNTDRLNERKQEYRRNSLIASGVCITASLVDIFAKNRWVRTVAQLIEVSSLAAEYLFIGKAEGIEEFNSFAYDDGDD